MSQVPPPDNYNAKEVYAFYGLAAYHCQVLEKSCKILLSAFASEGLKITRTEYDALISSFDRQTLGQLLRDARTRIGFAPIPNQMLIDALAKRNWLIHQYFEDRAAAFVTEAGYKMMIDELREVTMLLQAADAIVTSIYKPILTRRGISEAQIQQEAQTMVNDFKASIT